MLKIIPSNHFKERLGNRSFDLSLVAHIVTEISKNPARNLFEITSGFTTFVVKYERDTHTAILVTGWNGNRGRQVIGKNRYLVTEK